MRRMSSRSRARQVEPAEVRGAELRVEAALQRALARLGLLDDLLQHEVRVRAAVVGLVAPRDACVGLLVVGRSSSVDGAEAAGVDHGDLAVVEVDDLLACGAPAPRRRRRRTSRARRARSPPGCRCAPTTMRSGWRASSTAMPYVPCDRGERLRTACSRSSAVGRLDQMREHLGVGLGAERRARRASSSARSAAAFSMMPLCTTAMLPRAVDVRMRVGVARLAVRRPARVRDADGALAAACGRRRLELRAPCPPPCGP